MNPHFIFNHYNPSSISYIQTHLKKRRIYQEIEELEEYYETIQLTIAKNKNIIIHITNPISKDYPKNLTIEIPNAYPFKNPKVYIPSSSSSNVIIDYETTIQPKNPDLKKYLKEFGNYPNDHFFCPNFIDNIWSPAHHIRHIILDIGRINQIKQQIKYAHFLEKIFPTDIRRYIMAYIPF